MVSAFSSGDGAIDALKHFPHVSGHAASIVVEMAQSVLLLLQYSNVRASSSPNQLHSLCSPSASTNAVLSSHSVGVILRHVAGQMTAERGNGTPTGGWQNVLIVASKSTMIWSRSHVQFRCTFCSSGKVSIDRSWRVFHLGGAACCRDSSPSDDDDDDTASRLELVLSLLPVDPPDGKRVASRTIATIRTTPMDPTRMNFGLRLVCLENLLGMDEKVALDEDVAGVPAASTSGDASISNPASSPSSLPAAAAHAVTVAIEAAGCRASLANKGIVSRYGGLLRCLATSFPMPDANAIVLHSLNSMLLNDVEIKFTPKYFVFPSIRPRLRSRPTKS